MHLRGVLLGKGESTTNSPYMGEKHRAWMTGGEERTSKKADQNREGISLVHAQNAGCLRMVPGGRKSFTQRRPWAREKEKGEEESQKTTRRGIKGKNKYRWQTPGEVLGHWKLTILVLPQGDQKNCKKRKRKKNGPGDPGDHRRGSNHDLDEGRAGTKVPGPAFPSVFSNHLRRKTNPE